MRLFKKGVFKRYIFTVYVADFKHSFTIIAISKAKAKKMAPSIAWQYLKNLNAVKLEYEGEGELW